MSGAHRPWGSGVDDQVQPTPSFVDYGMGMKRYRVNNTQYVGWSAQTIDRVNIWYGKSNTSAAATGSSRLTASTRPDAADARWRSVSDGWLWDSGAVTLGSTVRVRRSCVGFILEAASSSTATTARHPRPRRRALRVQDRPVPHRWRRLRTLAGRRLAQPRLFIWNPRANDWGTNDAATFRANVDTPGEDARPLGTRAYSVLLVGNYRPARPGTIRSGGDYQAGLRARPWGNVAYLPLQPPWPGLYPNTANT